MKALAEIYGFKVFQIKNNDDANAKIDEILSCEEPVFCEVMLPPNEAIGPKVASMKLQDGTMMSKPLEDLAPFLPRDEFYKNMLVKPLG